MIMARNKIIGLISRESSAAAQTGFDPEDRFLQVEHTGQANDNEMDYFLHRILRETEHT
jgi:hypothetical protein